MHMSPVEYVIYIFGGVRKTARAIHVDASAVSHWRKRGLPKSQFIKILEVADIQRLDIQAEDLIFGRKIKQRR